MTLVSLFVICVVCILRRWSYCGAIGGAWEMIMLLIFRWHNCTHRGLMVICSYIFQEGNCCVDKLASLEHALTDTTWYTILPSSLLADFARDRNGLPNYRFP